MNTLSYTYNPAPANVQPRTDLETITRSWSAERGRCADDAIHGVDARFARLIGLPVMASLADFAHQVEQSRMHESLQDACSLLMAVARGEAYFRLQRLGVASLPVGAVIAPRALLERDFQGGGR